MTETVTDIIVARSRQSEGLQTMVLWSAAGHVLLMARPAVFRRQGHRGSQGASDDDQPRWRTGTQHGWAHTDRGSRGAGAGATGCSAEARADATGTHTAEDDASGSAGQTASPAKARRRRRQRRMPDKTNTGPQPTEGNARAETPVVRGQGFGLSSAGGVGGPVQLDVTNFCCPDYLAQIVTRHPAIVGPEPGRGGIHDLEVHDRARRNNSVGSG